MVFAATRFCWCRRVMDHARRRRVRSFKIAYALIALAAAVALTVRWAYGVIPTRELEAAKAELAQSSCSQTGSTLPPDDHWRAARDHAARIASYRFYRHEAENMDTRITLCCASAYTLAESEFRTRVSHELSLRAGEGRFVAAPDSWRDHLTPAERAYLCGGPWKECDMPLCSPTPAPK